MTSQFLIDAWGQGIAFSPRKLAIVPGFGPRPIVA